MTRFAIQATHLANEGTALGVGLWTALEAVHLNNRRDAFESALQVIVQSVRGRYEANLIEASAMLALIDQFKHRTLTITKEAEDAYAEYVRFLEAEAREEAADFANDMAREVA